MDSWFQHLADISSFPSMWDNYRLHLGPNICLHFSILIVGHFGHFKFFLSIAWYIKIIWTSDWLPSIFILSGFKFVWNVFYLFLNGQDSNCWKHPRDCFAILNFYQDSLVCTFLALSQGKSEMLRVKICGKKFKKNVNTIFLTMTIPKSWKNLAYFFLKNFLKHLSLYKISKSGNFFW